MNSKEVGICIFLCLISFVGGLGLSGMLTSDYYKNNPIEKNITNDKALLLYNPVGWGENLANSNQYLFQGFIYNFGNQEAKNINLICGDLNNNVLVNSIIKNIGNVASNSYQYIEVTMDKNVEDRYSENNTGTCYVYSSDNGINLIKSIHDSDTEASYNQFGIK